MGVFDDVFTDAIVYWPPIGYDQNGKPILGTPVALCGRWEDTTEEYLDKAGQAFTSKAEVFVPCSLLIGGRLWQGSLKSAPPDPYNSPQFVFEIRQFETVRDLEADDVVMFAVL